LTNVFTELPGKAGTADLSLSFAVGEHLLQAHWFTLNIVVDKIWLRRTGAIGIGLAVFAINDAITHACLLGPGGGYFCTVRHVLS